MEGRLEISFIAEACLSLNMLNGNEMKNRSVCEIVVELLKDAINIMP